MVSQDKEDRLGTIALATCALAVWHVKDREWARAIISAFEPVAELACGVPWTPLPAGHFFSGLMHTLLEDSTAADEAFTAGQVVHERLRAPVFTAMTNAAHGRALADVEPSVSGELIAKALDTATVLGLRGVQQLTGRDHTATT